MDRCLICSQKAQYGDLCKNCWLGLKMFQRDTRLLGRAVSYLSKNKKQLRSRHQRRKDRKRRSELSRLVQEQRFDQNDRRIRFEHAILK